MPDELGHTALRKTCDPGTLMGCGSTGELSPLEGIIGQDRAVRALKFGLDIKESGFNIFVAGLPGTGRTTAVKDFLDETAKTKLIPADWCYVNNFNDPYQPKALKLPSGRGREFQKDMASFVSEARRVLPKAFESEDYAAKKASAIKAIEEERKELFSDVNRRAEEKGFALQSTPVGLLIIPIVDGRPLSDEDARRLSSEIREDIQKKRDQLSAELRSAMRKLKGLESKISEELRKVNREVALFAIGHLVADLKEKYQSFPEILTYVSEVQDNVLEKLNDFIGKPKTETQFPFPWMQELPFRTYEVNCIVDNSNLKGAPVVVEPNPTYQNLFGRMEKEARFGVLSTDFTMIRGGSMHRANGGYLVVPVEELFRNVFSWDGLKRAIKAECVTIEEAGERLGFITTKGLRPEPISLDVKVILIGTPMIYQTLYMLDADFKELFKVKADFDNIMDRKEENMKKYAAFICTFCRKEKLKHLDPSAVARVIEYGSRLAADQEKLSTRFAEVADVIREANFYAAQENSEFVAADHVRKAIEERIYRSNLIQEKIQEMMQRNVLLIDTEGEEVGQVNGLSVMSLGDFSFGAPSRVTASIGLGREGIIDIQREARLAGPIHTKGVMILSGYLTEKYAKDRPLSLSARLVFEQSYGMVEGDSASSTELYAILSALSGASIKQSIAVTGSVNQKGEVQAIGGVNQKVEGYFEVCKVKGLTGHQGVMIPESNVQNLMLKEEVIDEVKKGKFHIYPVKTIADGIEILTGVKAGARTADGTFEKGTINSKVDEQLKKMAERLKEFPEFALRQGRKD